MGKKEVIFGPWFGEFGWELARWNPACRHLANTAYKNYHKTVIAPIGHKIIYEFADEFIDIKDVEYISNMTGATHKGKEYVKYSDIIRQRKCENVKHSIVDFQKKFKIAPLKFNGTLKDIISKIANNKKILVLFPRQRSHDARRNWPLHKWVELVSHYCKKGYHVFTFGGPEDSPLNYKHDNYTDFISYNSIDELDLCISALNLAECGVAIQSGGIYISLYSCKMTASFGIELHRNRLKGENHLNSKYNYFTSKDWNFPVKFLIDNIDKSLCTI